MHGPKEDILSKKNSVGSSNLRFGRDGSQNGRANGQREEACIREYWE